MSQLTGEQAAPRRHSSPYSDQRGWIVACAGEEIDGETVRLPLRLAGEAGDTVIGDVPPAERLPARERQRGRGRARRFGVVPDPALTWPGLATPVLSYGWRQVTLGVPSAAASNR